MGSASSAHQKANGLLAAIIGFLVGHPGYYPRFGFVRASQYGIRPEYEEVPDEAFMIIVFDEGKLQGITGVAHERPEFAAAM